MFDALGFNYENGNIMFDLVRQPSLDNDLQGQVYFMKQRQYKRKEKKDEDIIIDPWKKPRLSGVIWQGAQEGWSQGSLGNFIRDRFLFF